MRAHRIWVAAVVASACSWAAGQSPGTSDSTDSASSERRSMSAVERWKSAGRRSTSDGSLHDRLYGAASASMAESAGRQNSSGSGSSMSGRDSEAGVYGNASRAMLPARPGDTPLIDMRSSARRQP